MCVKAGLVTVLIPTFTFIIYISLSLLLRYMHPGHIMQRHRWTHQLCLVTSGVLGPLSFAISENIVGPSAAHNIRNTSSEFSMVAEQ